MTAAPELTQPVLQYRWQLRRQDGQDRLVYYGLRNYPNHTRRVIPLSGPAAEAVASLTGQRPLSAVLGGLDRAAAEELAGLAGEGIIVERADLRRPATVDDHQTCVRCANNDYVIPGLEFDDQGECAFCQCFQQVPDSGPVHGGTITDAELLELSRTNKGRFDAMVLYTGGKDSSFLLWYLAKKLGLKVLAATWDLPFTNDSSRQNMENARRALPNVEFVVRTVRWEHIRRVSRDLFDRVGLPCICPIIANVLFYPLAALEGIPYILDGVEAAQLAILTKIMARPAPKKEVHLTDRQLSLRLMNRLADPPAESDDPWDGFLALARDQLGTIYDPLRRVLAEFPEESLPLNKRLKSEEVYGTWGEVREIIERELNWQMPPGQAGLLHTSCDIETVKDYSQFRRFVDMETLEMPQSAVELCAAVHFGQITRDQALRELSERGYWQQPEPLKPLLDQLEITPDEVAEMPGQLPCILSGCKW